jgi:hypothetical protein
MRSVIRPAFVGLAVVGMAFAGAASAQASCDDDFDSASSGISHSFNDFDFDNSFNNSIIDGDFDIN